MTAASAAWVHAAPGLRLADVPVAEPGPDEVQLRVRAVGFNRRDVDAANGARAGTVPGSDAVAEVIAVGERVAGLRLGQRVVTLFVGGWRDGPPPTALRIRGGGGREGVLRRTMVCPAADVVAIPDTLDDADATWLPCAGVTAWNALDRLAAAGAPQVLIGGGGAVAAAAMAVAGWRGWPIAAAVSAATPLPAGVQRIDRVVAGWGRELAPRVDAALALGAGMAELHAAVRPGGRILVVSTRGGAPDAQQLILRQQTAEGVFTGAASQVAAMAAAMAERGLRLPRPRAFAWAAADEALLAAGRGERVCVMAG